MDVGKVYSGVPIVDFSRSWSNAFSQRGSKSGETSFSTWKIREKLFCIKRLIGKSQTLNTRRANVPCVAARWLLHATR